ncbi:hypothetical protein [Pseudofrankia inefficax]|uniref:Uncharacterized protein n=1 Tax=Pseudofrankia inefficax (strain DSM 45817 / CECT 9037 / DDB 130130 / EuI1c) TaxID=298654 RepID=E3J3M7_PSEI1|nr:hypothetical protein [Pseudofrankia inefficax]ADP79364.1 hypothetical protein FraEuI1c_1294 [Pseudofrankia inefficax]
MNRERMFLPVPRALRRFTSSPVRLLALMVAVLAAFAIAPPVAANAAVPNNYIFNNSSVGIGVWHDYHSGTYDAVLPAYSTTKGQWGWDHASKFFVGSTYCYNAYRRPAGSSGAWQLAVVGSGPATYPDGSFAPYNSNWWLYDWQIQLQTFVGNFCGLRV